MSGIDGADAASFRDPSGFVFTRDGEIFRQVNMKYKDHYDLLMSSGLYGKLTKAGLLVKHEEVGIENAQTDEAYKVLKPEKVPFLSYPYTWCFSQLKDAALATLKIQKRAYKLGMVLKDASSYNIQFVNGKPVFIDTLSFEKYEEGAPWIAYRQFCQHFLAPLALMACTDVRLLQLMRIHVDGIPLDLAGRLLPFRTKLRVLSLTHIHLHAKMQKRYEDDRGRSSAKQRKMGKLQFMGLMESLESAVKRLAWRPSGTEWGDYYGATNYSEESLDEKGKLISRLLDSIAPTDVWDLGANTGKFSRIAASKGIPVMSFDIDPAAVEKNYRQCRTNKEKLILPLLLDVTNPGCAGWENEERPCVIDGNPADTIMALALIHHLAISNNLPFDMLGRFLARRCKTLIIEFVPKSDSQVKRLLATREDIFPNYNEEGFTRAFSEFFTIEETIKIKGTERTLYLMRRGLS